MEAWTVTLIVALIGAGFGAIPGLAALYMQRRKSTADVAEKYEAMAKRQADEISELRKRVYELGDCVEALEDEVKKRDRLIQERDRLICEYLDGIDILINQIVASDHCERPNWRPKKRKET